jgi:hypothetical protein
MESPLTLQRKQVLDARESRKANMLGRCQTGDLGAEDAIGGIEKGPEQGVVALPHKDGERSCHINS